VLQERKQPSSWLGTSRLSRLVAGMSCLCAWLHWMELIQGCQPLISKLTCQVHRWQLQNGRLC
jgi:hypothetical protein